MTDNRIKLKFSILDDISLQSKDTLVSRGIKMLSEISTNFAKVLYQGTKSARYFLLCNKSLLFKQADQPLNNQVGRVVNKQKQHCAEYQGVFMQKDWRQNTMMHQYLYNMTNSFGLESTYGAIGAGKSLYRGKGMVPLCADVNQLQNWLLLH